MQGKKVLNRSWVTPYSLGFQADQLIKLIISSFVLVLEVIRILLGSSLLYILSILKEIKLVNGVNAKFQRTCIFSSFLFFLSRSPESIYWKDSIFNAGHHTDEVDYEEKKLFGFIRLLITEMNYYGWKEGATKLWRLNSSSINNFKYLYWRHKLVMSFSPFNLMSVDKWC